MQRKLALRLMVLACAGCMGFSSSQAQGASLSDSVSRALSTHPVMQSKEAAEDMAGALLREQKSNYYPTIGATARAGHLDQDDNISRSLTGGNATSWLGEGSLTLTQPLFAGFGNVERVNAARDRAAAARFESGGAGEDIALKAARAHLNLMRTRELLNLANDYLERIKERKASIALMVDEGAADEAELLQADEIYMAVRATRLGYEEGFRQAEADYIQTVGAPPGESLEFGQDTWAQALPATLEEAIAKGASESPRVKSASSVVDALGHDADVAKSSLFPQVNAELSYLNKDQDDQVGGELKSAQAMLKMSWSFSTGGGQLARHDRSLSERREAQARRDDARRTVEHDVRQKFTSMQIVDRQFLLMQDREEAAERLIRNYAAQFEGGRQTNLQLINANSRLFDAKAARTDAFYRRLLARFELLNVMGRLRSAFRVQSAAAAPDGR